MCSGKGSLWFVFWTKKNNLATLFIALLQDKQKQAPELNFAKKMPFAFECLSVQVPMCSLKLSNNGPMDYLDGDHFGTPDAAGTGVVINSAQRE